MKTPLCLGAYRARIALFGGLPRAFLVLLGASLAALSLAPAAGGAATLRAGLARVDITPAQPVTLAGYASRTNLSQGVHDPLSARVVAFEEDGQRLVLVSTDILGFYAGTADAVRQRILDDHGLRPSELFLAAIHTHSAPSPALDPAKGHSNNLEYTRILATRLTGAVREALAGLAPVQVGFGLGSSPVGANRREPVTDAAGKTQIRLGRNPGALTDREVQVLALSREGAPGPVAVMFAYATHSTSLGPGNLLVSGDVHGLAEQFVERYLGNGVLAPGFAGASGDIDPWFRILPGFNTTNGWIPEPVLLGTLLGEEVVRVAGGIRRFAARGPVKTAFKTLSLPGKARDGAAADPPVAVPLNVTVGRVGDIAFVGLGGEVFNGIGRAIKAGSPFACTLVLTHCNGTAGYLPVAEACPEGGYEVQSSSFGPAAAERAIEEIRAMLREL